MAGMLRWMSTDERQNFCVLREYRRITLRPGKDESLSVGDVWLRIEQGRLDFPPPLTYLQHPDSNRPDTWVLLSMHGHILAFKDTLCYL